MTIPTLIDKQDNAELVRNQIAAILKDEADNQVALAITAGKPDPDLWALRVFIERANPWGQWKNTDEDQTPIVNVWWEGEAFDRSGSNTVDRQKASGTFYIDCYGLGVSRDQPSGAHKPGDLVAAETAQRAARLCRNILMAAENVNLQMQGIVWSRFVESISLFQPEQDGANAVNCLGARITLNVVYNETAPQVEESTLCYVGIQAFHTPDGELLFAHDTDYEAPPAPQQQLFAKTRVDQSGTTTGFAAGITDSTLTPSTLEVGYGTVTVGEVFWNSGTGLNIIFGAGTSGQNDGWTSVAIDGTVFNRADAVFTEHPVIDAWMWPAVSNPFTVDADNSLLWTLPP